MMLPALVLVLIAGISHALELREFLGGTVFSKPLFILQSPTDREVFYVAEQRGVVWQVTADGKDRRVFIDIRDRVRSGGEMGLLGIAFDPDFPKRPYFYLSYTSKGMYSVVSRVRVDLKREKALKDTEKVILRVKQPYSNHNGGNIIFGPDGYLYLGLGDGGSAGDPLNHAQNLDTLLGSMLRIDVRDPEGPRVEVFAIGLRNPWRWSFDRKTGQLWAGDVGQDRWEEIDIIEKGKNYGWRCYEGFEPYNLRGCGPKERYTFPVHVYPLRDGNCSVIGGYVYRGKEIPELYGWYIFGDYCSGRIWALKLEGGRKRVKLLFDTEFMISSFGEDGEGNIYVIDHRGGKIYKIER